MPPGTELLLFNEADAGFGDVAFATRLLGLLARHDGGVRTTLISSRPDKQRIFGLPDDVKLHGFDAFEGPHNRPKLAPDIVVSAPGIFDHCRFRAPILERLGLTPDLPFVYLAQYGSIRQLRDDDFKAFMPAVGETIEAALDDVAHQQGLDPDAMGHRGRTGEIVGVTEAGIRSLGHLAEFMIRPGGPLAAWLHTPVLDSRSCGLEAGEIGLHVDEELVAARVAPAAVDRQGTIAQLQDRALAELLADPRGERELYFGYAYSGLGRFVDVIAALEQGQARDLDVVVPNARAPDATWEDAFDPERLARLRAVGVGRVQIVGNPAATEAAEHPAGVQTVSHELGAGSTLRLITRYPIPNADWRRLLLASAPPTMVSGDQSITDAISADKAIAIMEPVYCQTYLIDALIALAEATDAGLAATVRFGMAARWDAAGWQATNAFLASGGLVASARRMNATIRDQFDASMPMVHAIRRRLWSHRLPALAALQSRILADAWRSFDPVAGLTLDPGPLLDAVGKGCTPGP